MDERIDHARRKRERERERERSRAKKSEQRRASREECVFHNAVADERCAQMNDRVQMNSAIQH
jgi:hypothetical protein